MEARASDATAGAALAVYTHCLRCKRALKNPEARRIGYGKVCLAKVGVQNRQQQELPMAPTWEEIHRDESFVCIVDLDKGQSVTNGAEYVVARLDPGARRVLYRDTMGHWDELVHENGKFTGYRFIGGADHHEAIRNARGAL